MKWTPQHIHQLREKLNMTQEQFAREFGVRRPTISDWETGKVQPSRLSRRMLDIMEAHLIQEGRE